MQAIAREFSGRIGFVKVNIDRDGGVLERFGASGLPAYVVFRDGVEIDRMRITFTAAFLKWRIRRMLDAALEP